jgi:hypothetical protein
VGDLDVLGITQDDVDWVAETLYEGGVISAGDAVARGGFVGLEQEVAAKGLGSLHKPEAGPIEAGGYHAVGCDLLYGICGGHCGHGGTVSGGRLEAPVNELRFEKGPRAVVDQNQVAGGADLGKAG